MFLEKETNFGSVVVFSKRKHLQDYHFCPVSNQGSKQQEELFKKYGLEEFIVYDYGFLLRFGIFELVSLSKLLDHHKSLCKEKTC